MKTGKALTFRSILISYLVKGDGIQAVYGPKADVLKSDINDIL